MKILKNAVISAVIGHAFGIAACLVGAIFALKMPNSDTSSAIFGVLSCTVGAVAVALASKIQGHGSVICAVLSGAIYAALDIGVGTLLFDKGSWGFVEAVMLLESFLIPLLWCFTGVTFMGRRRKIRRKTQKIRN